MKNKDNNIVIIIIYILSIISILTIIIYNSINNNDINRKPITSNEFYELFKSKKFSIENITNKSDIKGIKTIYKANNINNNEIYFYEFNSNKDAINQYKKDYSKLTSYVSVTVNEKDYNKYEEETSTNYILISRIKNTILYINISYEYKDEILSIIDELNYR